MAITTYAEFAALSVSTTELSLVSGTSSLATDTTAGVFTLRIDASNMAKGDSFVVRGYEAVRGSGTKRKFFETTLSNAQSVLFFFPPIPLKNGWDFTIQRTAGSDRAFDTSILKAA